MIVICVPAVAKRAYLAVFKRSFVSKVDGAMMSVAHGCEDKTRCFPFPYPVMNQYMDGAGHLSWGRRSRPISVLCSLRPRLLADMKDEDMVWQGGSVRNRVLLWLRRQKDLPEDAQVSSNKSHAGLTGGMFKSGISSGRRLLESKYKQLLRNAFVAVTANPSTYEGDHRLWEHFAVGNAVLSDHTYAPIPYGFVPGVHYAEFDTKDLPGREDAFHDTLRQLLRNDTETTAMACRGFQHAARHHRSVSRVDYIVRSLAEVKFGAKYDETGVQVRQRDKPPSPEDLAYGRMVASERCRKKPMREYIYHV